MSPERLLILDLILSSLIKHYEKAGGHRFETRTPASSLKCQKQQDCHDRC